MENNPSIIPNSMRNPSKEFPYIGESVDLYDKRKGKNQEQVNKETDDTFTFHQSEINALNSQNYVTVSTYSSLPEEGSVDTIYRVSFWDGSANIGAGDTDATVYSEYAWDGIHNEYKLLAVRTAIGEIFDISLWKAVGGVLAEFTDLTDALGTNGENVPAGVRRGGMTVKFVLSSDNKYVQYRLMSDTFNTTVANWQGVDDEPTANSRNLVESGGVYNGLKDKVESINDLVNGDFGISDEQKNIILLLKNGHLKTKNFNSGQVAIHFNELENQIEEVDGKIAAEIGNDPFFGGFGITDESKYAIVIFKDGHIKTKEFDSAQVKTDIEAINSKIEAINYLDISKRKIYLKQLDEEFIHNNVGLVGNFVKREIDGVLCACTYGFGSELIFKVQNTSSITANFKLDNNTQTQQFIVSIDDGDWSNAYTVSNSVQIADNLSLGQHIVRMRLSMLYNKDSQYATKKGCMNFASLTLDAGAICSPLKYKNRKILILGDSISSVAPNVYQSYNYVLADKLNACIVNSSLPGMGLIHGSATTLPTCQQLFETQFQGFVNNVNEPDFVIIAIGQNDTGNVSSSDYVAAYKNLIESIRNRYGGVLIFATMPFKGQWYSETTEAIADYDNVILIDTRDLTGTYTTSDGLHPDAAGAVVCANYIYERILNHLSKNYFNNF